MKISARNNRLSVVVTPIEYMRIYEDHEGEYVDIITDDDKTNVLFPKRRKHTDKNNVYGTIRQDDAQRFEEVEIICHDPFENTTKKHLFTVDDIIIQFYPDNVKDNYDDLELGDYSHVPPGVTGFRVIFYFVETFFSMQDRINFSTPPLKN